MVERRIGFRAPAPSATLESMLRALETEFKVPGEFDQAVLDAAQRVLQQLPPAEQDHTHLPFFTLDPPTSTDLDQAMYLEQVPTGYRVHYAIADVPAIVQLGTLLDEVTRARGQTYYLPHRRVGLHPNIIAEDGGSLLPGATRRAFIWVMDLDEAGALQAVALRRSAIRSRAKLGYPQAQQALDDGSADAQLRLLKRIGLLRIHQEQLRQGASLKLPDQEVQLDEHGNYQLISRFPLPVEDYNAQISLLTGMAAARLMLDAGVGILRTMAQPEQRDLEEFRAHTRTLGHPWDRQISYGQYLRTLDVALPADLVIMHRAGALFRGADYQVINGQAPGELVQAALAAPYTHATAPLRRLVDRFVLLTCHLLVTGQPIPQVLHEALAQLPGLMRTSATEAARVDRAAIDLLEAWVMHRRVGEVFQAVVLRAAGRNGQDEPRPGTVQLLDEAVTGIFHGQAAAASLVRVRLVRADPQQRVCQFEQVDEPVTPSAMGGQKPLC